MQQALRRLLSAQDLLKVITSQSLSTLANQIVAFVIPWLVLAHTGSAFNAGVVAFAAGTAQVIGTLFGGIIIDRIGGRVTSIASDILSFGTILILPVALYFDFIPFWLILVTHTAGILSDGPGMVAKDTMIPITSKYNKVPLLRASSIQEVLQGTAMFIGPMTAGLLVAAITEGATLLVVAAIFVLCALLIFRVKKQKIVHEQPMTIRQSWADMREGFVFLMKEPLLGPLTILGTIFVGLFMPLATIIFPAWFVFAGQNAEALGIFLGAQALGGLLGGLVFTTIATKVSGYVWMILSNILSTIFFGAMLFVDPGSWWAVALSFLVGTTSAGFYPIMNTAYYSRTPEKLFGRVNGASWALSLVALPVTSLLFGWIINLTSATIALGIVVASNAILTIVVWLYPSMKLLDTREAAVNVVRDEGLEVK